MNEEVELFFWDEEQQTFRNTKSIDSDSLYGLSLFASMPLSNDNLSNENGSFENSEFNDTKAVLKEWELSLSATDGNSNGLIEGKEGYNFIQFLAYDSMKVSDFIYQIEQKIGENYIHPNLFKYDENQSLISINKSSFLHKDDFFWLKSDSVFERSTCIIKPSFSVPYQEDNLALEEPISNFDVVASTDNGESILKVNVYDALSFTRRSRLNPYLNLGFDGTNQNIPIIGVSILGNWMDEIHTELLNETYLKFPLGVLNHQSDVIALKVKEWNMQSGWDLYIEDVEQNIRYPLSPGKEFILEYTTPFKDEISTQKEILVFKSAVINKKYNLLITTPDFNETGYDVPEVITLHQNYPNPFNPATFLSFYLPENQEVKLSIFNVVGQLITILQDGPLQFGEHRYEWNATGYPSGMYIYQLEVGNKVITRKMTLVK